jgi:hypothetical protein
MQLTFSVNGTPAVLNRSAFTGNASLDIDGKTVSLASAWDLTTHFSLKRTKIWRVEAIDRQVVIEKTRPWFFAGLRQQTYRVWVDGELVAEQTGY